MTDLERASELSAQIRELTAERDGLVVGLALRGVSDSILADHCQLRLHKIVKILHTRPAKTISQGEPS